MHKSCAGVFVSVKERERDSACNECNELMVFIAVCQCRINSYEWLTSHSVKHSMYPQFTNIMQLHCNSCDLYDWISLLWSFFFLYKIAVSLCASALFLFFPDTRLWRNSVYVQMNFQFSFLCFANSNVKIRWMIQFTVYHTDTSNWYSTVE